LRISSHGTHLTALTRLRFSNAYFVREPDGLTLIDTSLRGSAGAIIAAARDMGASIRRIVITHAHHDHAGSLEPLVARLPNAEVLVGERESALLAGDFEPREGEPRGRLRTYLYEHSRVKPSTLLRPGDRIGSLEVLDASGHTPGQIALLDTRDRTLLCGDAFLTIGKPFVTTELVARFPFPALSGTWHAPTALKTAERLCDLEPKRLATGHGRVVESPAEIMREALRRARRKKAWG
jgi:glyoxylase-like metal-dependent hydrolase (beta-lactamase superfamily II)